MPDILHVQVVIVNIVQTFNGECDHMVYYCFVISPHAAWVRPFGQAMEKLGHNCVTIVCERTWEVPRGLPVTLGVVSPLQPPPEIFETAHEL